MHRNLTTRKTLQAPLSHESEGERAIAPKSVRGGAEKSAKQYRDIQVRTDVHGNLD